MAGVKWAKLAKSLGVRDGITGELMYAEKGREHFSPKVFRYIVMQHE